MIGILKELEKIKIGETVCIPVPTPLIASEKPFEKYVWEKKLYITKISNDGFSGKIETIIFDPIEQTFETQLTTDNQ